MKLQLSVTYMVTGSTTSIQFFSCGIEVEYDTADNILNKHSKLMIAVAEYHNKNWANYKIVEPNDVILINTFKLN